MNVQLLSISPVARPTAFDVALLIGTEQLQFTITVEIDQIGDREIQIVHGDRDFSETFRFNQKIAADICKLVSKVYNHQAVSVPSDLGEFYPDQLQPALV